MVYLESSILDVIGTLSVIMSCSRSMSSKYSSPNCRQGQVFNVGSSRCRPPGQNKLPRNGGSYHNLNWRY
jgi:hypothetical protein